MWVGLAVDQQSRAAIVKDHVIVVPLPPSHDVTGEEASSLGLGNGKRLGRDTRLRDVPLGMEAERRQRSFPAILLPVDHAAPVLGRCRPQHNAAPV